MAKRTKGKEPMRTRNLVETHPELRKRPPIGATVLGGRNAASPRHTVLTQGGSRGEIT